MIKNRDNNINKWYNGSSSIKKIYQGGHVRFQELTLPTGQTPCFAVVDDITQYQDRSFSDVYNRADSKWYKLNNVTQYEEYGVYGQGRDITTYEGKLTVDGNYEYQFTDGSWVNLGEGEIIKSPEYIERTSAFNGHCGLLEKFTPDTKIVMKHRQKVAGGGVFIGDYNSNDNDDWRVFFASRRLYYDFNSQRINKSYTSFPMSAPVEWEIGNYYIKDAVTGDNILTSTTQTFSERPNQMYIYHCDGDQSTSVDYGEIYSVKIYRGDTLVREFIPWTDMNGNYGLYDKVNGVVVNSVGSMTGSSTVIDVMGDLPKSYDEVEAPPATVTFATMADALAYECPYVGLIAYIAGDTYVFNANYEWEAV